jgi:hypothetical protein
MSSWNAQYLLGVVIGSVLVSVVSCAVRLLIHRGRPKSCRM